MHIFYHMVLEWPKVEIRDLSEISAVGEKNKILFFMIAAVGFKQSYNFYINNTARHGNVCLSVYLFFSFLWLIFPNNNT